VKEENKEVSITNPNPKNSYNEKLQLIVILPMEDKENHF